MEFDKQETTKGRDRRQRPLRADIYLRVKGKQADTSLLLAGYINAALFAAGWKSTVHWYTLKSTITE